MDNAMLYERPTGHVIRTSNWAQTLPPEQRPVFTQGLAARSRQDVDAIWKFALTDEDTTKLSNLPTRRADAGSGVRMVVARSGGYCPRRQQQRQTPGEWVNSQGLSMQDVVAFGDNYNDISMLEAAVPAWRWAMRMTRSKPAPTW
jgi:hydroxymethylpyrimidine pyrophosphatase-like HAD family hydrolase